MALRTALNFTQGKKVRGKDCGYYLKNHKQKNKKTQQKIPKQNNTVDLV